MVDEKASRSVRRAVRLSVACFAFGVGIGGCNLFIDAGTHVTRAKKQMEIHDYRAAVIELHNALQSEPGNATAHLLIAEALLRLGDPATAKAEAQKARDTGAAAATVAPLAAQARIDLHEYRELTTELGTGKLPLSAFEQARYRGLAALGLGETDAAIAAFEQALQLNPSSLPARIGLAQTYLAARRTTEATRELDQVLRADRNNSQAGFMQATIAAGRGEYESAEQTLMTARVGAQAQLSVPQQMALLTLLTEVRIARRELPLAREAQRSLAELNSNAPIVRVLAGRIALTEGDYTRAVDEFRHAVTAAPNVVAARFLLGSALAAQGSLNQAESELAQVIADAPDNFEARRQLARVRLRLDKPEAAMKVLFPEDTTEPVGSLALGDAASSGPASASNAQQVDRDLQLVAARSYLKNGDPAAAVALLTKVPPVAGDTQREGLLLTALAAAQGRPAAEAELERLLAAKPRDTALLELAAVFLAQQDDFAGARARTKEAMALRPQDPGIFITAARIEHAGGDSGAAANYLEKALTLDPNNAIARLSLAELAVQAGDFSAAERQLEDYGKRDAKSIAPRLLLAKVKMQLHQRDAAAKVLQEVVAIAPERADVLNEVGAAYSNFGLNTEAIAQFKAAVRIDPKQPVGWLNLGKAQLRLNQTQAARESFEAALRQRPDWPAAVGGLAMLDLRDGKRDAASGRIEALQRKRPDDAAVAMLQGDFEMTLARYSQAADAYVRAARIEPTWAAALMTYRAREAGKLPNATQPLEDWLSRNPDDQAAQFVLAEALGEAGQTRQAIERYERLIGKHPSAAALNNLAWAYHTVNDPRALPTAKRAYDMTPKVAAVIDTYGWILLESGKPKDAAAVLEQAALTDGDPDISYHYAVALSRNGDHNAAKTRLSALLAGSTPFANRADARRLLDELSEHP